MVDEKREKRAFFVGRERDEGAQTDARKDGLESRGDFALHGLHLPTPR